MEDKDIVAIILLTVAILEATLPSPVGGKVGFAMASFVTGYADPLVAKPGSTIAFMISGGAPSINAEIVRLSHGALNGSGPGRVETSVHGAKFNNIPCFEQQSKIGSYAVAPTPSIGDEPWTIRLFVYPTSGDRNQTVLFTESFSIDLTASGELLIRAGGTVKLGPKLRPREWSGIAVKSDPGTGRLLIQQVYLKQTAFDEPFEAEHIGEAPRLEGDLIGFGARIHVGGLSSHHYDGKVDKPLLFSGAFDADAPLDPSWKPPANRIFASWDFGKEPEGTTLHDTGPRALNGRFEQQPARAVTGCLWSCEEVDWRNRPDEYSAAHFHSDDLDDIGWLPSLSWQIPRDLPSGVYALRVECDGTEDRIPFFVPQKIGQPTASVAVLIPTYSYLAYANERTSYGVDFKGAGLTDRTISYDSNDQLLRNHPEFGVSMYDHHSDGSGVMYASWKRPLINLRPDYLWWLSGGPQYLSIDLCILHWLEQIGQPFDIITDHDLAENGVGLLEGYRAVLTSSHPEYLDLGMLKAIESYTHAGGRFFYMGGNGFYWVATQMPQRPWTIEVRRGFSGNRAWESDPGEEHHASTGERGGLWRRRGRYPNALVGIGFAAQGWDLQAKGYSVSPQSTDPRASWIFDGITASVVGDFGLVMDGAAGDELDRADFALGTPHHALVLGSSSGHSRYYLVCQEDALFSHNMMNGELNPNVRADLCFFETPSGGAVFSVGSKAWVASLSHNGYDNSVARLSQNVLQGFLQRDFSFGAPQ